MAGEKIGLKLYKPGVSASDDKDLYRLGKIDTNSANVDFFWVFTVNPGSSKFTASLISIGHSNAAQGQVRFYSTNLSESVKIYYDKETFDYYIKPPMWHRVFMLPIYCFNTPNFTKVALDPQKHVLLANNV